MENCKEIEHSGDPETPQMGSTEQCGEKVYTEPYLYLNLNTIKEIRRTPEVNTTNPRYTVRFIDGTEEKYFVSPMQLPRLFGRQDWVYLK